MRELNVNTVLGKLMISPFVSSKILNVSAGTTIAASGYDKESESKDY